MKITNRQFKQLDWQGKRLSVPANHYFVAMDKNGVIWSFTYKPSINFMKTGWNPSKQSNHTDVQLIANAVDAELLWSNSLIDYSATKK